MANLDVYRYIPSQTQIVGTPILTNSPVTQSTVDQTTSRSVLSGFNAADLTQPPFNYYPSYPLLMKLFCHDVVPDRTGEFIVTVTGSGGSTTAHRMDNNNFALTWSVPRWDSIANVDTTVSVRPIAPMTSVKFNCICGIATDNIDRPSEN